MAYDPKKHHRRSIRLRGHDYTQEGSYFVTICTHEREPILGEIIDGSVILTDVGEVAQQCWDSIQRHFHNVELGEYVIMPNHVHGVIFLREIPCRDEVTSSLRDDSEIEFGKSTIKRSPTLGQIIAFYKYQSTKIINAIRDTPGMRFWQRNYYEHIIRDDKDLDRICKYIANNVVKWSEDKENPDNDHAASIERLPH